MRLSSENEVKNLQQRINELYKHNSQYNTPEQAVNQADSLDALSKDLYADSKRFIYELLQNADDSTINGQSVQVWIKIIGNNLIVAHSGKPFSERDAQGICNINNGTKKSDISKTGYKGIGFKSVFGQSKKVIIYTNQEYFKFDAYYDHGWKWENSQADWEQVNDRKFQYPWQIIPIYIQEQNIDTNIYDYINTTQANVATIIELQNYEETCNALEELSQKTNMYLFLKNISRIFFDIESKVTISIDKDESGQISLSSNDESRLNWLSKNFKLLIPEGIRQDLAQDKNIPEKFKEATQIDLTLCAQIKDGSITKLSNSDKLLYSYLPTEETKYNLPVLVNASFLTTANRESLHLDSRWNQWLFEQIGVKLFEWIAELVQSEYQFQSYNLLPDKLTSDSLGKAFNEAMGTALETIPFVVTKNRDLVKIRDSIVDFTFLSEKDYVGEISIKKLLDANDKYFTANTGFGNKLIELGAIEFNWKQVVNLFSSTYFQEYCSPDDNINLIEHLFSLSKQEKFNGLKKEDFKNIPFILDHKNGLCIPERVCFPSADNLEWNDPSTNLSFIHKDIQEWLRQNPDIKDWLEVLGVLEKTDITYILQTILPNIQTYISQDNAISEIQRLFYLYDKGDLKKELLGQLSQIKLLTTKGQLVPANECHLSNFYNPRFAIEKDLDLDIFVSDKYCSDEANKNEWKRFFTMLMVEEKTSRVHHVTRSDTQSFIDAGYKSAYFNDEDKLFFNNYFSTDQFSNITTINYIECTLNSLQFSHKFWTDFLAHSSPSDIKKEAIAFWGYNGRDGKINGSSVQNYIPWYIKNIACIPTTEGNCYSAPNVFLNLSDIKEIGGNYLPIFDGIELNADWKSFFKFKTELALEDYLSVLTKISQDTEADGTIKVKNVERVKLIYKELLKECINWREDEISVIQEWGKSNQLLNTEGKFIECNDLKYFLDGNESIFQGQFNFININAENQQQRSMEELLTYLGVQILKYDDFELIPTDESYCIELKEHLKHILPYFKIWIEQDTNNDIKILRALEGLQSNISQLSIKHALALKIQYPKIGFIKDTNTYFHKTEINVTKPWNSNSVLLELPKLLCRYLSLVGYEDKLNFLLRADIEEIQKYFAQENINIPEDILSQHISKTQNLTNQTITNISEIKTSLITHKKVPSEYFHVSEADLEKYRYTKSIISRAMVNILHYLSTHNDYDCTNHYEMADSIIGGIKKNGHEITIVARPSDKNQVILYDGSEFDVLSHTDAEFWHEDGITPPRQIRIGQLITQLEINRIPIRNINISTNDLITSLNAKSQILDFDAIPFVPEKMAKIIASFANTDGGKIIFGVKESVLNSIEVVGLNKSINVVDIVHKAIAMLSPIPSINYEWVHVESKNIFLIEVEKQNERAILLNDVKYIRDGIESVLEKDNIANNILLKKLDIKRTIAIIISIENYADRQNDQIKKVKYATEDAKAFKQCLIDNMLLSEDNIHMFVDQDAYKSSLDYDLSGLFRSLEENDQLIFYYAGHGFHDGITNYLSTYDTHPFNIAETSISLRQILLDPLQKSKCKNALIFIDACAQMLRKDEARNSISDINIEEFSIITDKFPNFNTFLSCHTGQSSYSCDDIKHGVWTYFLNKALSGHEDLVFKNNQYITNQSLRDYLSKNVSKYVENKLGYEQSPKAILDSNHEVIIWEKN